MNNKRPNIYRFLVVVTFYRKKYYVTNLKSIGQSRVPKFNMGVIVYINKKKGRCDLKFRRILPKVGNESIFMGTIGSQVPSAYLTCARYSVKLKRVH